MQFSENPSEDGDDNPSILIQKKKHTRAATPSPDCPVDDEDSCCCSLCSYSSDNSSAAGQHSSDCLSSTQASLASPAAASEHEIGDTEAEIIAYLEHSSTTAPELDLYPVFPDQFALLRYNEYSNGLLNRQYVFRVPPYCDMPR